MMAKTIYQCVVLMLCVLVCESIDFEHSNGCKANEYYNKRLSRCTTCSLCTGKNLVIRKPCKGNTDTICGPFTEFENFHQSPGRNGSIRQLHVILAGRIDSSKSTNVPIEIIKDGRWYTLAMTLVGVLTFVSLLVVIYIVLYCFVCKKKRGEKQLIYDPEVYPSQATTRYTDLPSSRDRLKKHMMTSYIEETVDSSGVVSHLIVHPRNGGLLAPNEQQTDEEADNSGQTVSSTGTNYVYFKTKSAV